jgi:hypothetical protein
MTASVFILQSIVFSNDSVFRYLKKLNWSVTDLVGTAHQLSATMGLAEIPAIQKKTIGKMGLKVHTHAYLSYIRTSYIHAVDGSLTCIVYRVTNRLISNFRYR